MWIQIIFILCEMIVLSKTYRLKGKEVNFLSKKRQYFWAGLFGFFYRKQYPQIPHHQISFHVTIKYSKRATERNIIKRAIIQYIQEKDTVYAPIGWYRYKIFVVLNKSKVADIQQKIANLDKKGIIEYIKKEFSSSRWAFTSRIARTSDIRHKI